MSTGFRFRAYPEPAVAGVVHPLYPTPEVPAERVYDIGRLTAIKRKPQQSAGQA